MEIKETKIKIIDEQPPKRGMGILKLALSLSFQFILITAATTLVFTFLVIAARVQSGSMENTLMTGTHVFATPLSRKYERGDIAIFETDMFEENFIKRIVAVGGDTVEIKNGKLYINGEEETYETWGETKVLGQYPERRKYEVPEDHYLMFGDNRENSLDSRAFDEPYIHKDALVAKGRVVVSFFTDDGKFYIRLLK